MFFSAGRILQKVARCVFRGVNSKGSFGQDSTEGLETDSVSGT
jgi:hypothetical protein